VLAGLTVAPDLAPEVYEARFDEMRNCPETYYTLVFEHVPTRQIIATATLFVERKFLRNAGKVGHIEDVAVDASRRGKNLGKRIIVSLTTIAESVGCYKTILDCNEENIRTYSGLPPSEHLTIVGLSSSLFVLAFYQKCGFTHKEFEMVKYAKA
jgi:glucosamine-phosphate N-acetyltransferase